MEDENQTLSRPNDAFTKLVWLDELRNYVFFGVNIEWTLQNRVPVNGHNTVNDLPLRLINLVR